MLVSELRRLYDYGAWATARLFQAVETLSPEEFIRTVGGAYGSVRNTLVHTLSAEWGWVDRCGGHPRGPKLDPKDYPTVESLRTRWREVHGYQRDYLGGLGDADLDRPVEFSLAPGTTHPFPVGALLQHGAIHSVHHRGQVALLLRMLGHPPGNFDLLFYDSQ